MCLQGACSERTIAGDKSLILQRAWEAMLMIWGVKGGGWRPRGGKR